MRNGWGFEIILVIIIVVLIIFIIKMIWDMMRDKG
jgi:hypothetical protein